MLNDLVSEFQSARDQVAREAAGNFSPITKPRYEATTSAIRTFIGQLKAVGISAPYIERLAWGFYWSSEESGESSTFRQGHLDVDAVNALESQPKLTIYEWLFDPEKRTTGEVTVLA